MVRLSTFWLDRRIMQTIVAETSIEAAQEDARCGQLFVYLSAGTEVKCNAALELAIKNGPGVRPKGAPSPYMLPCWSAAVLWFGAEFLHADRVRIEVCLCRQLQIIRVADAGDVGLRIGFCWVKILELRRIIWIVSRGCP